eukprot:2867894-Prymnesium_polylepis.1
MLKRPGAAEQYSDELKASATKRFEEVTGRGAARDRCGARDGARTADSCSTADSLHHSGLLLRGEAPTAAIRRLTIQTEGASPLRLPPPTLRHPYEPHAGSARATPSHRSFPPSHRSFPPSHRSFPPSHRSFPPSHRSSSSSPPSCARALCAADARS